MLIVLFPLFLLSVSVLAIVFDPSQYDALFGKLGVYTEVPDAKAVNQEVLRYLLGKEDVLPEAFNTRERQHMADVKGIFDVLKRVLFVFPLLCIAALFKWGERKKAMGTGALNIGSVMAVVLFAGIIPVVTLAFPASFAAFHGALFEEGSYLFDPSAELLVQLYPEQVFFALGWRIAVFAALLSLLALFFSFVMKKDLKHGKTGKAS